MPAQRKTQPADRPAWYEATADLYIGGDAGTLPARAFTAGDRVPPDLVEANGWQALVRDPLSPPRPAPAAEPSEPASSKE